MDRARDFHFVKQLPRSTVPEVEYSDDVYDRQVLLNEAWSHYALRVGYGAARAAEEHVKWVTETWEEYEHRVPQRTAALTRYFDDQRRLKEEADSAAADRQRKCDDTIARLMKQETAAEAARLKPLHTLYVDFEEELLLKQKRQRADMEAQEAKQRAAEAAEEAAARRRLQKEADESYAKAKAIDDERRRIKEEEEARIKEEQRKKAEALRRIEEEKKKAAEEAERKRREEEEEAKRAERRRKDEERRAKAKAEREARAGGGKKSTRDEQRNQSRQSRWARMTTEMADYLAALEPRCAAVQNEEELNQLIAAVTKELGGNLLFHSAVYIGVPSADGATMNYPFASDNCSAKLRSGSATLERQDPSTGGMIPLTIANCVDRKTSTGIVRNAQKQLVNIGDWPSMGTGDYVASPVVVKGSSSVTKYVICCDTMSSNTADATLAGGAAEEHCYAPSEGATGSEVVYVQMPENQGTFLEKVAEVISGAATRLASPATKEASGGAPVVEATKSVGVPALTGLESISTLPNFFNALTGHLHDKVSFPTVEGKLNCYISRRPKADGKECTVVSHNGIGLADPTRHTSSVPCHLLGATLADTSALTFTAFQDPKTTFAYVANVADDSRCKALLPGATKVSECLFLFAFRDATGKVLAHIGISAPFPEGLSAEAQQALLEFLQGLQEKILELLILQHSARLCHQAAEWIELTTGTSNVYLSLKSKWLKPKSGSDDLQYVAATSAQQWLVGKELKSQDTIGISHSILASAGTPSTPIPVLIPSINKFRTESGATVKKWDDAKSGADGALLLCPITHGNSVFGLIYADTLGDVSKKPKSAFTKSDEQLIQTTAVLLGGLLAQVFSGRPSTPGQQDSAIAQRILSVEELVGVEHIEFLKQVWVKVTTDIKNITKDQLLEMSRYNSPPPVIPITVAATFIVLGTKPKSVQKWEDARPKIKLPLIDKLVSYDPTSLKVKKAFFLRAKKMTKGYTADDVFTKGSYPASCFFTWTWVTILLRKSSDLIRKRIKNGEIDLADLKRVESEGTELESGATEELQEEELEEEGGDDGAGAEEPEEPAAEEQ